MKHQLIVTFLGANRTGILSQVANLASAYNCNILDSRQAIYGEDFSLTMILEGSLNSITKMECELPHLCLKLELLSMMKRTRHHNKQHLERLADMSFFGTGAVERTAEIMAFCASKDIRITAFRQHNKDTDNVKCKMIASLPSGISFDELSTDYMKLLEEFELSGHIEEKT
ncbi:glycine cleavage system transcriptional repressor [Paraneptunicella aestuarii]|uniref:glycine cleavage system protein R n=1 Tax=Paraneptunicella aestuarii TaxID=2831148 RepID=UPI001E431FC2|nr:ACT domain-containing protein [Paraneptunicella aestuarii]UAA40352.1 glycine cleavage system transcriptional repressor [Paraneptunicella aestuarii]